MLGLPHLSVCCALLLLCAVFAGVGSLVRRACRSPAQLNDAPNTLFVGFAATLAFLQLWHLFFRIDWRATTIVVVVGLLGVFFEGAARRKDLGRSILRSLPVVLPVVALLVWLSHRCLSGITNGDSGLYHVPYVRWVVAHPLVLGLGNLSGPLSYAQSYFLYVGMLEVGPFLNRSHHLANGLLLFVALTASVLGAYRVIVRGHKASAQDLFHALLIVSLPEQALGANLTSPSPDLPVFVLGIAISSQLLALLTRAESPPAPDYDVIALVLLAVAGVTVKLSLAPLAIGTLAVAAGRILVRPLPQRSKTLLVGAAVGLLVGVPWLVRGVLLSGYPAYPSTVLPMNVAWRLTPESIDRWAKPLGTWPGPWWELIRDTRWLKLWLDSQGCYASVVTTPLTIAAVGLLLAIVLRLVRLRTTQTRVSPLILVPTTVALALWFTTAPRPRFAGSAFWLLAAQAAVLAVENAPRGKQWVRRVAVAAALLFLLVTLRKGPELLRSDLKDFERNAVPRFTPTKLQSGLIVNVPFDQGVCWSTPLPCTSDPDPNLRLRREGDSASGFLVAPSGIR